MPTPPHLDPALLAVGAACDYSSFSRSGLYILAKEGKLEMRKHGKRTFVVKASLDKLIAGLTIATFPI